MKNTNYEPKSRPRRGDFFKVLEGNLLKYYEMGIQKRRQGLINAIRNGAIYPGRIVDQITKDRMIRLFGLDESDFFVAGFHPAAFIKKHNRNFQFPGSGAGMRVLGYRFHPEIEHLTVSMSESGETQLVNQETGEIYIEPYFKHQQEEAARNEEDEARRRELAQFTYQVRQEAL